MIKLIDKSDVDSSLSDIEDELSTIQDSFDSIIENIKEIKRLKSIDQEEK